MKLAETAVYVLPVLVAGFALGNWASTGFVWSVQGQIWGLVSIAGAFGGMLYTIRDGKLVTPHRDKAMPHHYNLGWISDCAYGIGGAYVIFLLVPTEIGSERVADSKLLEGSVFDQIKLIALALVGGYGGRSLVDRALTSLAKRIDEVEESAGKVVAEKETDALALELVQLHLDEEESGQDVSIMKPAISSASRGARFEIFKRAREVRTANWREDPNLCSRTIPIFEALIENLAGESYHRNHAQLGYALKDKGGENSPENDWVGAYEQLNTAIAQRNKDGKDLHRADGSPAFLMYEFNRAICGIKLGHDSSEVIADLQVACGRDSLRQSVASEELFATWAAESGVDLDAIIGDDPAARNDESAVQIGEY